MPTQKSDELFVFTDGSAQDYRGGAGVILRTRKDRKFDKDTMSKALNYHCSVYECEMQALKLAFERSAQMCETQKFRKISVFSDSLSCIQLVMQMCYPSDNTSQQIILKIRRKIREILRETDVEKITIYKVKAHAGINGNEAADKAAKEALKQSKLKVQNPHMWNLAVAKRVVKEKNNFLYKKDYQVENELKITQQIEKSIRNVIRKPRSDIWLMMSKLSRAQMTIIVRAMTNRLPTKFFMNKIGNSKTRRCSECGRYDTSRHYLFYCRKFSHYREIFSKKLQNIHIEYKQDKHLNAETILYGFWTKGLEVNLPTQIKFWKAIVVFVKETNRFPNLFGPEKTSAELASGPPPLETIPPARS